MEGDSESQIISTKCLDNNKQYSVSYRKAAYCCLVNQVPVETTGIVIQTIVKEIAGKTLDSCADATTVSQFSYELGTLSDIQCCESMLENDNLTLSWDATSLQCDHINEIHVSYAADDDGPPKSLCMQINTLPGGTATDYVNHVIEALNDSVDSYCNYHKMDRIIVMKKVEGNIANTLTDRVNVNHCARKLLEEKLDIELLELNCNVHPLDGIAGRARSDLKKVEAKYEVKGKLRGEGCAVTLIHCISKMRYKQGTGDPKGFKQFLRDEKISSRIVRYVGNRIHVLFHLGGIIFMLQAKLIVYLTSKCSLKEFSKDIAADLRNPAILLHLRALGLLGKLVTGPWMTVLYGNKQNLSNLELVPILQGAVSKLKSVAADPPSALSLKVDIFEQQLKPEEDGVLLSLQGPLDPIHQGEFEDVMKSLLTGATEVLERQLKSYLTGDLSSPTEELIKQTKSAPAHNIFSERVLGHTDQQCRRAPNRTMGFIDGKVRACTNKTLEWLSQKSHQEQDSLISFAVGRAAKLRDIRRNRQALQEAAFQKRRNQKFDSEYRKKIQKMVNALVLSSVVSASSRHAGTEISPDFIEMAEITDEKCGVIKTVLHQPLKSLIHRYIQHIWFENDQDVCYHGQVLKAKKTKANNVSLKVAYWSATETAEDAEDSSFLLDSFLTDFILGDLVLLE